MESELANFKIEVAWRFASSKINYVYPWRDEESPEPLGEIKPILPTTSTFSKRTISFRAKPKLKRSEDTSFDSHKTEFANQAKKNEIAMFERT